MAPTPKAPGARRRRNPEQKSWRTLPAAGRTGKPPALPARRPAWLKRTRVWWKTIWASPMATAWEPADVEGLIRLAELKELFARGKAPATAMSAMQQLEDRYGLNPKSRQQMLWLIEHELEEAEDPPKLAQVRRLRAVDPSATSA